MRLIYKTIVASFVLLSIEVYSNKVEYFRRRLGQCPDPDDYPKATQPLPGCSIYFVDEDFETYMNGWFGNIGGNEELSSEGHTSQYLKIANRRANWLGPILEIDDDYRKCLQVGVTYFFSVKIRLSKNLGTSNCKALGTDCPVLKWTHMDSDEKIKSLPLVTFKFTDAVDDGTWFHWLAHFDFPTLDAIDNFVFSSLFISGPEAGVDISIDEFQIYLPPAEHFPVPGSVCDKLVVNGFATAGLGNYPIASFDPRETLSIKTDNDGNYFSMDFRKNIWSGPKTELIHGCIRDESIFQFTSKIWIHDSTPRKSRVIVRYNEDGRYQFETVAICPDSSESIGWVDCSGEIRFLASKFHTPPFVLSWMTHDTTAPTDWRAMKLSVVSCGAINIGDDDCTSVRVNIDAQVDPNIKLVVSNGNHSANITSNFISIDRNMDTHWYTARRFYTLSVGDGDWSASFKNNENDDWPYFAETMKSTSPNCTNFTSTFTIIPPPVNSSECDNIISNSGFEIGDYNSSQWYHSGGNLKIVDNGVTGRALSTDGRTNMAQGLVQFIDTRCMTAGKRYDITAKVKLIDPTGATVPKCDPNFRGVGGTRCPRANIRSSESGTPTSYSYALGNTLAPFTAGEWNVLYGSFTIDDNMEAADQIAFYIDGVIHGIDIVIDDVYVTSSVVADSGCLRNGDFEIADSRHWECVGSHNCALKIVQPGHNSSSYALSTKERQASWWGMKQDLSQSCFSAGVMYEVKAWMKLKDASDNDVTCDPYLYYQGLSDFCPNAVLQHPTDNSLRLRVGSTVGPLDSGWNQIYGVFNMTQEMLSWPKLEIFFGWAKADFDILIDNVSIEPVQIENNCLQLVQNGGAETGDARNWYLKGSGDYGTISVVSGGAGDSAYAFYHSGWRSRINQGLYQELDKSCMPINSVWKIYSSFKFFDKDGNPADCFNEKSAICLHWRFEAMNGGGKKMYGTSLTNEKVSKGKWVEGEWNDFESTFTVDKKFDDRERIFIHIMAPIGFTYMVDNIRVMASTLADKLPNENDRRERSKKTTTSIVPTNSKAPKSSKASKSNNLSNNSKAPKSSKASKSRKSTKKPKNKR